VSPDKASPTKLDTVQEEETKSSQNVYNKVQIAPLPLDQIMTRVSSFGINLDSLESRLGEANGLGLKPEQLNKIK
jgi:hypothetical protein